MAREYMSPEEIEKAKQALAKLKHIRQLLMQVGRVLDGTHVDMPSGPTVQGALECADLHLYNAEQRLIAGAGLNPEEVNAAARTA